VFGRSGRGHVAEVGAGALDEAHDTLLADVVAEREGDAMAGNAAFCFVEKLDDPLSNGGAFGGDGVFEVVAENKIRSVVLVQTTSHRRKGCMGFYPDAVGSHEIGDSLELGLVFGASCVVQMAIVSDEQIVGLELRHNVEEDTLGVRLVVAVHVNVEPLAPVAHVLTIVAQRIDHLFPGDELNKADLGEGGFAAVAVCDPGGLLDETGNEALKALVKLFVERRWSEMEEFCEVVGGEEEK